jgi:hypothetical protein
MYRFQKSWNRVRDRFSGNREVERESQVLTSASVPPVRQANVDGSSRDEPLESLNSHTSAGSLAPDHKRTVLNTLKFTSSLVENISDCIPVPGLKGAIGSLNFIIRRLDVRESRYLPRVVVMTIQLR